MKSTSQPLKIWHKKMFLVTRAKIRTQEIIIKNNARKVRTTKTRRMTMQSISTES